MMFAKKILRCLLPMLRCIFHMCGGMYLVGALARLFAPRRRLTVTAVAVVVVLFTGGVVYLSQPSSREVQMERQIVQLQLHMQYMQSLYHSRQQDIVSIRSHMRTARGLYGEDKSVTAYEDGSPSPTLAPEIMSILRNMSGMRAAAAVKTSHLPAIRMPFVYHLMPHLLEDPHSLRPAYHLKGGRHFAEVVLGIPTVKRDRESYLMITLTHLLDGFTDADNNSTLIIVYVGETDLEFVLKIAKQIETKFPKQIESGTIEVIAPSPSYYPDLDALQPTLGDSMNRMKWRTKQNLDAMYLMSYAQSKGTYYLMLEDDIIAKNKYLQEIKKFVSLVSVTQPQWMIIEFCRIGGIGKMFRSANLMHFVAYVQLFYTNLPIDWLVESYIMDMVCTVEKFSKSCAKNKLQVKPKYKSSLFQHIGLYSSLKGKIQKIKDAQFGTVPTFYPHTNPPALTVRTDISDYRGHTLKKAYEGSTFFWGMKPNKDDLVEFVFQTPLLLERYLFRSSNVEHVSDKFYDTSVEVLTSDSNDTYIPVGVFDDFGLAEGSLMSYGLIRGIRLHVNSPSSFWVILSEIEIQVAEKPAQNS